MQSRVVSAVVLKTDLANVLRSTLLVNESLGRNIPVDVVDVYRAGFQTAIAAVAAACGVELSVEPGSPISKSYQTTFGINRP